MRRALRLVGALVAVAVLVVGAMLGDVLYRQHRLRTMADTHDLAHVSRRAAPRTDPVRGCAKARAAHVGRFVVGSPR